MSYNEMSARYAPLPDFNYLPTVERLFLTSTTNKQAQAAPGAKVLDPVSAENWLGQVEHFYDEAERICQSGLRRGVPKEVARVVIPVGRYSQMRATANLRNWLAFMTLRHHPLAQWEIQQFAGAVGEIIKVEFPQVWGLFEAKRGN